MAKANVKAPVSTGDKAKDAALADPKIRQRTDNGVNYTACFVMLCKGMTLREIAQAWDIDYTKLRVKAGEEDWTGMIVRFGTQFAPELPRPQMDAEAISKKIAAVEKNRETTIDLAHGIMMRIKKLIDDSEETGLESETIGHLARALKMVGELSMLAHGDEYIIKSGATVDGRGRGPASNGPQITINMPSIVASPRRLRQVRSEIEGLETKLIAQGDPVALAAAGIGPGALGIQLEQEDVGDGNDCAADTAE